MSGPLVLATDLDGTMAGGSDEARAELKALLAAHEQATLIYVTGRTPGGARDIIASASLPQPAVLIADVGTSVLRGTGPERIGDIEAQLERGWPGVGAVRERLDAVAELSPQDIEAPRRVSYWVEPVRRRRETGRPSGEDPYAARAPGDASLDASAAALAEGVAARAAEGLEGLSVDVVLSANVFLDVLPRGVNKGTTLRRVLRWLGADESGCVVAGDSLNDLALFDTGLPGIVVGNCEPALAERVAGLDHVYRARATGAGGVLEGLRHHGHFRRDAQGGGGDGE